MRDDCTAIRMSNINKMNIPSVGKDMKQLKILCTAGRNIKWYNHFRK